MVSIVSERTPQDLHPQLPLQLSEQQSLHPQPAMLYREDVRVWKDSIVDMNGYSGCADDDGESRFAAVMEAVSRLRQRCSNIAVHSRRGATSRGTSPLCSGLYVPITSRTVGKGKDAFDHISEIGHGPLDLGTPRTPWSYYWTGDNSSLTGHHKSRLLSVASLLLMTRLRELCSF
jgi:hypothetical protein